MTLGTRLAVVLVTASLSLVTGTARAVDDPYGLGNGSDGAFVAGASSVVNRYVAITTNAGSTVTVTSATGFVRGDLVMAWRSQASLPAPFVLRDGTAPDIDLTTVPVGFYELGRITNVVGNIITLDHALIGAYGAGAQLVRVPEFTNVTIGATGRIVPQPWNGTTGGIVAFLANETVTMNTGGIVEASARGFRGGRRSVDFCLGGCATDQRPNISAACNTAAGVGEGLAVEGLPRANVCGAANLATGGGGGGSINAGGAGGGNGGKGGVGGNAWNRNAVTGGFPSARAIAGDLEDHLLMGGGGGGGQMNNSAASAGAAGGGVVFIRTFNWRGDGRVRAIGGTATAPVPNNDGQGGGGAGGSVFIRVVNDIATCPRIHVFGGNGASTSGHGNGGGGGGGWGRIDERDAVACAVNVVAGSNGTMWNFPASGAGTTPPQNGRVGGTEPYGCVTDAQCGGASPICDPVIHLCRPCSADAECGGATPFCARIGTNVGRCVTCTIDTHCDDGNACTADRCAANVCSNTPSPAGTDCGGGNVCSGATAMCVDCTTGADCADGNDCTSDVCTSNTCSNPPRSAGTMCSGGVCDGASMCAPCVDGAPIGMTDPGCTAATPFCDTSGAPVMCKECGGDGDCTSGVCDLASNSCVPCVDDGTGTMVDRGCSPIAALCDVGAPSTCQPCLDDSSATDLGCVAGAPVCDETGATHVCVTCEDSAAGTGVDNGCNATTPVCDLSGAPTCVECLTSADCAMGTICGGASTCVPGCEDDLDCDGVTPICDGVTMTCAECTDDTHCGGVTTCSAMGICAFPDTDGDGVTDEVDLDDDNDGIPDVDELGGTDTSADTDGNDIPDYLDAAMVGCADGDADGVCDAVPSDVDLDGDGVPNHLDADADGDGITDTIEGGGSDADGDGQVDGFADANGDGLDDATAVAPLPLPNTDMADGPDFLDVDADGDGVPDASEAHDDDHDGVVSEPSGSDSDGDGIDDAFDPDCDAAAICAGGVGTPAPTPDLDLDGAPDYVDDDDDGDSIPTAAEVSDGATYGDDVDGDGAPNWYDTDSDGDEVPDMGEVTPDADGDGIPENTDMDADGVPDYLDPDSAPTDMDGDSIPDVVECPDPSDCPDSDGDGTPDVADPDDDDDGVPTLDEVTDAGGVNDLDGDGRENHLDVDADGDGITDDVECGAGPCVDTDGDGSPDYLDLDADDDGVPDATEGHDADTDGAPDAAPSGSDADMDGLDDSFDPDSGGVTAPTPDTDGDGAPDFQDDDDDGDGLLTVNEDVDGNGAPGDDDSDGDGVPNYLDPDDDGDGTPTLSEGADPDGDGDPADAVDTDMDGTPDYLQPGEAVPPVLGGGVSGGALCAATGAPGSEAPWLVFAVLGFVCVRRRR